MISETFSRGAHVLPITDLPRFLFCAMLARHVSETRIIAYLLQIPFSHLSLFDISPVSLFQFFLCPCFAVPPGQFSLLLPALYGSPCCIGFESSVVGSGENNHHYQAATTPCDLVQILLKNASGNILPGGTPHLSNVLQFAGIATTTAAAGHLLFLIHLLRHRFHHHHLPWDVIYSWLSRCSLGCASLYPNTPFRIMES